MIIGQYLNRQTQCSGKYRIRYGVLDIVCGAEMSIDLDSNKTEFGSDYDCFESGVRLGHNISTILNFHMNFERISAIAVFGLGYECRLSRLKVVWTFVMYHQNITLRMYI